MYKELRFIYLISKYAMFGILDKIIDVKSLNRLIEEFYDKYFNKW